VKSDKGSRAKVSLVERRRQQTRAEIAEAAAELFVDRGFEATTIEEIAAAAGISQRTFFRYFPRKEDIVMASGETGVKRLALQLEARPRKEPLEEAMRAAIDAALEEADEGPLHRMRMTLMAKVPALRARWLEEARAAQDVLAEVVARRLGVDASSVQPRLVAASYAAMTQTVWEMWAEDHDLREVLAEALDILTDGLFRENPTSVQTRSRKRRSRRPAKSRR
jgi:AcrR family transcriptional regulator